MDMSLERKTIDCEQMSGDMLLKTGYDIAFLISCVLNNKQLNKKDIASMNLIEIYQLCCRHSITALVGSVLKPCCKKEEFKRWDMSLAFTVSRHVNFECERQEILAYMREQGIWYVLLKGLVVGPLYPEPIYREMCDNDILYDPSGAKKLCDFMLERGYSIDYIGKDKHADGFTKPPYFNFELHKSFFVASYEVWDEYYSDMNKFLIPDEKEPFQYHLSDEDFYVYMICHTYKHFIQGGTGIRSLVDCYVYNQTKGKTLNWKYIYNELKKLQIDEFEQELRTISDKLFEVNRGELTDKEEQFFKYILSSGTYGIRQHAVENSINRMTNADENLTKKKYTYYWKRLFPDLLWFKGNVTFCYKHRWAIPFYYAYRILNRGFRHRKEIYKEIKTVNKVISDSSKTQSQKNQKISKI